jgi:hypothetical protein
VPLTFFATDCIGVAEAVDEEVDTLDTVGEGVGVGVGVVGMGDS